MSLSSSGAVMRIKEIISEEVMRASGGQQVPVMPPLTLYPQPPRPVVPVVPRMPNANPAVGQGHRPAAPHTGVGARGPGLLNLNPKRVVDKVALPPIFFIVSEEAFWRFKKVWQVKCVLPSLIPTSYSKKQREHHWSTETGLRSLHLLTFSSRLLSVQLNLVEFLFVGE